MLMATVLNLLKFLRYFDFFVSFNHVAFFDVVVVCDVQTAVVAREHFLDVVFKALERAEFAGIFDDTVADKANLACALDFAFADHTSCDCSYARNLVGLEHFRRTGNLFFDFGREHTCHSVFDFFDSVVDNRV